MRYKRLLFEFREMVIEILPNNDLCEREYAERYIRGYGPTLSILNSIRKHLEHFFEIRLTIPLAFDILHWYAELTPKQLDNAEIDDRILICPLKAKTRCCGLSDQLCRNQQKRCAVEFFAFRFIPV